MNRRIIVLLILAGLLAVIAVSVYAYTGGLIGVDQASEIQSEASEIQSEVSEIQSEVSEIQSEASEIQSEQSEVAEDTSQIMETEYDENGDLREDSKYLDEDGDTIANFYDVCPGVDDFGVDCDTSVNEVVSEVIDDDSVADENAISENADSTANERDENGDLREDSKYLDDDGDTIANYYDVCSGINDFSADCDTTVYQD